MKLLLLRLKSYASYKVQLRRDTRDENNIPIIPTKSGYNNTYNTNTNQSSCSCDIYMTMYIETYASHLVIRGATRTNISWNMFGSTRRNRLKSPSDSRISSCIRVSYWPCSMRLSSHGLTHHLRLLRCSLWAWCCSSRRATNTASCCCLA